MRSAALCRTTFDKVRIRRGRLAQLNRDHVLWRWFLKNGLACKYHLTQAVFGARYSWVSGIDTMFLERFCGPLKVGTVVPSARSMTRFVGHIALTRASQTSQPRMNFVPKRFTTLYFTIADRYPTFSERLAVPTVVTSRLLPPLALSWDLSGSMCFWSFHVASECLIKVGRASVFDTTVIPVVACLARPT